MMDKERLLKTIDEKKGVLLYFQGEHCNVCHALRPKLLDAFARHFPQIESVVVDAASNADIAAHFGVFSIPTAIVFLDGKEFARVGRNLSIPALVDQIKRPYEILTSTP
ncbi:thioredoxin family protein [Hydrogenimonas sp.]